MTSKSRYLCALGFAVICTTFSAEAATAQSYTETFDGETAPALPANWTAAGTGAGAGWVTSSVSSLSFPNALSVALANSINTQEVTSPTLFSNGTPATLTFQRRHDFLETDGGPQSCDAFILEVSINGGAFTDAVTAGGSFSVGGYNYTQHNVCTSAGFAAGTPTWSGAQPAFTTTTYNLPVLAAGTPVAFRFRAGADASGVSQPIYIDDFSATGLSVASPTPVPTLSEWAMILLGLMLAGGAALHLQRRRLTA